MRSGRFKKIKRNNMQAADLDITSLLDIITILLAFLLRNYNPSDLEVNLVKNIDPPTSVSERIGSSSVVVMVTSDKLVYVDGKEIGKLDNMQVEQGLMSPLLASLTEIKEKYDNARNIASVSPPSQASITENAQPKEMRKVNILLDKSLPYNVLRLVMHTAATAGYPEFKLIVKGINQ
ncbi:MAG: hypothetical protein A2504_09065 [Bdellovibrionales bacterium RIFOXYD12_FULL_39_22]|nr:MAG: hypothetical protein A2385_17485 [Bdellovibrionales bacterium RIFOXYB1_FULL_39_21]OFZ41109.1 MAG: hypothetical protein A2485_00410 [Bdellovibrionales bacterium RIFOXYC12_FULL_39_17]OFZ50322.1 MAG: hypothetical protein A2404_07725 [Bdellovibrionales bacterium RIFOXYC1_FULL_39_130]OFZ75123.1 MAG: hypothetical protein A2560_16420 [Bdellovibrionales bacterium RIFOXYD1_FULL_39_84]OFZ92235.1 MAG: hypothetical protein A2504_09065 [Bdellovibrionales bacterium RIFOXYD12_FULL_39_22]HLE10962.1 bi